jgi:hypothetical protein
MDVTGAVPTFKHGCVWDAAATAPWVVTDDPDANLKGSAVEIGRMPGVFTLSLMTDDYYGWFWCGGVVPEWSVSDMGGNFNTNGVLEIGPMSMHNLQVDYIGLGTTNITNLSVEKSNADETIVGYAFAWNTA